MILMHTYKIKKIKNKSLMNDNGILNGTAGKWFKIIMLKLSVIFDKLSYLEYYDTFEHS